MKRKNSVVSKVGMIIFILITLFILWQLYGIYKLHYYNGFTKAELNQGITKFTRDRDVRYSAADSYKIESEEYNDAMFFKQIEVKPNTPYRIRAMVKTENIVREEEKSNGGAQICIVDTLECSESITGTNDWQDMEFIFNSKNRETIDIGFRLGGNKANVKGTAWFSDFILEEGYREDNSKWNMVCFIFRNLDVEVDINGQNERLKLSISNSDIYNIKDTTERFQQSCRVLSQNKMSINRLDIFEINDPITSISYSEEFGYYINPMDVKEQIKPYLLEEEYDHIFVVVKLGDVERDIEIPVRDWIGLGGMDFYDIGFSNIRLPNDKNNYIYTYSPNINQFPEEVMLHEFLHSLERIMIEYEYDVPALHDNVEYGYEEERIIGLKNWYEVYMSKGIMDYSKNEYIGLDPVVYTLKPVHRSDFEYSIKKEFNSEPESFIEEISQVFSIIRNVLTGQPI